MCYIAAMRLLLILALFPLVALADPPQNGNSAFAVNLFSKMNEMEYASYITTFAKVIGQGEAGKIYDWSTAQAQGKISVGPFFLTKTRQYCRPFSESYAVGKETQTFHGIACRDKQGGWCKLREHSAYNCALVHPGGFDGWLLDTSVEIDRLNNSVQRTTYQWNSFTSSLPF
jgi:hypothetical protein